MKKLVLSLIIAFLLAACGDTVENTTVNQMGMEVVASEDDLPECTEDNEGEQAAIKGEATIRVCMDGDWASMNGGGSADFSCTTKELKDKSGLKIICNGDSIGVVLNGEKGEKGETGKTGKSGEEGSGCAVTQTDSAITVVCGDDSTTIELGARETAVDSDAVSLDSLAGYSQKGPFLRGSTVYLYELDNGKTLKQTNGNFTSYITRDDGYYKFAARNLVSPYALVIVDGYYRNEVTGGVSKQPIRLKALSDVRKHHKGANVNILTHLEYEYVYNLVTKQGMNFAAAKKKAQEAVFKAFGFDVISSEDAETLDIFGSTEADAALLAMSILLQGDRSEADMMALLSEIADEIAIDGKWNSTRADTIKAQIADWAFGQNLFELGENVKSWGLNDGAPVGDFGKYVNNFISKTYGIKSCNGVQDSARQTVDNKSSRYHGRSYQCYAKPDNCDDCEMWVEVRPKNEYMNDTIEYGTMIDWRDRRMYYMRYISEFMCYKEGNNHMQYSGAWMAENLGFDYRVNGKSYGNQCYNNDCDTYKSFGRYYTWAAAMDSAGIYSAGGANCGRNTTCAASKEIRGICPEGWRLPNKEEWETLLKFIALEYGESTVDLKLKSKLGWGCETCVDSEDLFGFSFAPSGFCNLDGSCGAGGMYARMWTSAEVNSDDAVSLNLSEYSGTAGPEGSAVNQNIVLTNGTRKESLYSVRCLRISVMRPSDMIAKICPIN